MFKALLRVQLAALLRQLSGGSRTRRSSPALSLLLTAVIGIAFGVMFYGLFLVLASLCGDAPWRYFSVFAAFSLVLCTVATMFVARGVIFDARDNQQLLSLPIPWRTVLGSRLTVLVLSNLATQLPIAIPAACWAPFSGPGSVVCFVVLALLLPLEATALAALLGWVLALIGRRIRHKSAVTVGASLVLLGAYLWFYVRLMTGGEDAIAGAAGQLLPALERVAPLRWMGRAMALAAGPDMLLSCLCLVLPFLLALALLSVTFQSVVSDAPAGPRAVYRGGPVAVSTPARALLRKELRRFAASPTYLLNTGIGLLLMLAAGVLALVYRPALAGFMDQLGPKAAAQIPSAAAVFLTTVTITAPSVSLEGKSLWLGQSLPVPGWWVLRAKLLLHLAVTLPFLLAGWLCLIVALSLTVPLALAGLAYLLAMAAFIALVGLYLGLRRANFTWLSETQVVKQGAAMSLTMLAGWAALILGFLVTLALSRLLPPAAATLMAAAVLLLLCLPPYRWLRTRGGAAYAVLSI